MRILVTLVFLFSVLYACKPENSKNEVSIDAESLINLGDSISFDLQGVLLKNVANAIKKGGTDYAVDYCNLKALFLTDSIANKYEYSIQRLSDKNRNPKNALQTKLDSQAWEKISIQQKSLIATSDEGENYFYKPINIGMPTCLKCHGMESEISESTAQIINQKYPNDRAKGYQMGELRGIWKIKL